MKDVHPAAPRHVRLVDDTWLGFGFGFGLRLRFGFGFEFGFGLGLGLGLDLLTTPKWSASPVLVPTR